MASLGSLSVTVGAAIDGFEKSMGTVSQRLNAIDREATKAFSGFEKVGDRLTTIGTGLTAAITLPLLGAAVAATKFATDFELGMRQVTSLLGGATKQEFEALSKRTLDLSRVMGIDAVKASNALYEAISAGVPKENAIDFLAVASKAAIAGVTDTRVAVDALTTIIAAYGLKFEDATKVSDALFQAVNVGKFKFEELAKSIGPAAAQAKNLGISYEELLAATSTLSITSGGVSIAVTQIESAMRALLQPTKEMQIALKSIGFETGEAAVKTLGFEGLLNKLREQTGGSAAAFNALFGRIEGYNAAIGLTGDRSAAAAKDLATLRNSTGAADKAFQEIDKTTARQFERLTSELKTTAIELGTKLLPSVNELLKAMRPLVGIIGEAVEWFTTLPAPVQAVGLGLAAVAIAAGPVVLVLGQIISTLATVLPALTSLGGAMTTFITTQAPAMVTGTGTIATAISALGSAAVLTAGVFVGWKLGSWAYEQIPGFKALGDALAESLLVIPGVEAAVRGLSGASAAAAVAIDTSEFAIKKQEEALKRLGIVLNKEGISTEDYAKRLRETVEQQIAMAAGTTSSTKAVTKSTPAVNKAAEAFKKFREAVEAEKDELKKSAEKTKIHEQAMAELGLTVDKTKMKTKSFADIQPVLAARIQLVEGEYKKNITELARMQLAIEQGKNGADEFATGLLKLSNDVGHLGTSVKDLPPLPGWLTSGSAIPELEKIGKAYESLGITSTAALKRAAEENLKSYQTLRDSGIASTRDLEMAWVKWQESVIAASRSTGEKIPKEQQAALEKMQEQLEVASGKQKGIWGDFSKSVSTVITNFAQDISKSLWDGDISWGQKGKDLLKSLGQSVTSLFIEPATAALSKFITGVLADLFGGKGFGGILDRVKDIGSTVADVFGKAPAGAVPGGGGASIPTGGGGGGGVAGAASGLGGTVDVITGAISAAANVVSAIYNIRIEGTLNAIEENTRRAQIVLLDTLGRANEFWPSMRDTHAAVIDLLVPTMRELRDGLKTLFTVNLNLKDSDQQALVTSLLGRVAAPDTLASDRLLDIHARLGSVLSATQDVRKGVVDAIGNSAQLLKGGLAAIEDKLPSTIGNLLGGVGGLVGGISGALGGLVSGLVGALVNRGQGEAIDLIEENTRYTAIGIVGPSGVVASLREFLAFLPSIDDRLIQFVGNDSWRIHDVWDRLGNINDLIAFDTNSILAEIRDAIRAPRITAQLEGVTGGASFTITGNTFRNRDDIDYMLAELRRNL